MFPEEKPAEEKLAKRLARQLENLREKAQLRELTEVQGINLYSNDYLGLAGDPRLRSCVVEAVEQTVRMGSTGSRLLSGHSNTWTELEEEFAAFAGTESALYFSSGYAANIGLLSSVLTKDDVAFSDSLNHASLIDGLRLSGARRMIYSHCDMNHLEELLKQNTSGGHRVIVTESIFSMEGDHAPLRQIVELAQRYGAEVVVDEAHATGTHGARGQGMVAELGLSDKVFAVVHTCGKALASMGAFVCGSEVLKRYLINHARSFIFSTAMPPYFAQQIRAALRLAVEMRQERGHLHAVSQLLRSRLQALRLETGASASQIIPLLVGANDAALRLAHHLQLRGFAVRAIRPPTVPEGTARLRFSMTARISMQQVEHLADAIAEYFSEQMEQRVKVGA